MTTTAWPVGEVPGTNSYSGSSSKFNNCNCKARFRFKGYRGTLDRVRSTPPLLGSAWLSLDPSSVTMQIDNEDSLPLALFLVPVHIEYRLSFPHRRSISASTPNPGVVPKF